MKELSLNILDIVQNSISAEASLIKILLAETEETLRITIEEGSKLVRSMGGVCYPAHIDREANGLLAVLGFFPEEPVFTLAEVHDEDKRDLAGGRKILVSSDAHRLWEISDGSFCVHLDEEPEAGEEAVRKALFAMLEKRS